MTPSSGHCSRDGGEIDVTIPDVGPRRLPLLRERPSRDAAVLDGQAPARGQRVRARGRPLRRAVPPAGDRQPRPPRRLCPARRVGDLPRDRGPEHPQPTREDEPMHLDASAYQAGVPELVAAELVRDVVEPKEFDEFCRFDCVTVRNRRQVLPDPTPAPRPDRGLGCQDPSPRGPALRRLPGSRHASVGRGRDEVPPRQAPARPPLAGRRPLQPPGQTIRGHTTALLAK